MTYEERNNLKNNLIAYMDAICYALNLLNNADELETAESVINRLEAFAVGKRASLEKVKKFKARGGEFSLKDDAIETLRAEGLLD